MNVNVKFDMTDFYVSIISISSALLSIMATFLTAFILLINSERKVEAAHYESLCMKLTRFRQLCGMFLHSSSISKNKYDDYKKQLLPTECDYDSDSAFSLFKSIERISKDVNYFEKTPSLVVYDLKDLDYYAVESNLVWLFLIDHANHCQAFTDNDLGNVMGVSESFVQSLINELSFGERYDRLNYSVLGNISGDIECSLIPNMYQTLGELDDIDMKKEKSYSLL